MATQLDNTGTSTEKRHSKKLRLVYLALVVTLGSALACFFFWDTLKNKLASLYVSYIIGKFTDGEVEVDKGGKKITYSEAGVEYTLDQEASVLPEEFPDTFPVFTDAKLISSSTVKEGGSEGVSVIWESDKTMSEVDSFYQEKLKNSPWQVSDRISREGLTTFSLKNEESSGLIALSMSPENKLLISITLNVQ